MKVIGAGFGRTGTTSLQAALEELGFARCYHMSELFLHPGHARFWLRAVHGEAVDWRTFFQDYQATVDWPGCSFYKELMDLYPDAKVLLNVREPDRWYESAHHTIYALSRSPAMWTIQRIVPHLGQMYRMIRTLIWEGTFGGRFADRQHAIEVFKRHNRAVQQHVPPERLLVYNVKEGWEPLCAFLDVPIPEGKPFPHLNDAATMRRLLLVGNATVVGLAAGVLAFALWLSSRFTKRVRGR